MLTYGFSKLIKLPFCIDSALSLVVFLYIGKLMRSHWGRISLKQLYISMLACVVGAFLVLGCIPASDFAINSYNIRIFLWAPTVSLLLFIIIQWLCKLPFVAVLGRVLGRNTMALMGYNITFVMIAGFASLPSETWGRAIFVMTLGIGLAFLLYKHPQIKKYIQ